jgi:hypothetical protein
VIPVFEAATADEKIGPLHRSEHQQPALSVHNTISDSLLFLWKVSVGDGGKGGPNQLVGLVILNEPRTREQGSYLVHDHGIGSPETAD